MRLAHDRGGAGEPLILVHGFASNRHVWNPVVPLLEREREVFRIDLPGFGDTPPLPEGEEPSPARLAQAVAGFAAELGLERPHVAGNSLGGWIALELAKDGRARSACALSPAGFWNRLERVYSRASFVQVRALSHATPVQAGYRRQPLRRALARQFFEHAERMTDDEGAGAIANVRDCAGFWPTFSALHSRHFTGGAAVRPPATIAWGERDRLLLPRQAERARRAMPQARHVWLVGCGHVPTYDDPELVARTILTSA